MFLYLGGHQPEGAGALSGITSDCVCAHGALGNFMSLGTSNAIPPLTVRRNSPVKGKPGWGAPNLPIPRGLDRCIGLRHLQLNIGLEHRRKKPCNYTVDSEIKSCLFLCMQRFVSLAFYRAKLDCQFCLPLAPAPAVWHVNMAVNAASAAASRQLLGVAYFSKLADRASRH